MTNSRATGLRVFWTCAIAVIAALVWITLHVLRLEDREALSQAAAVRQEATRLALWRMDSALTPVIAREASRPYFHYQSFYPTDRAFTKMLDEVKAGEVLMPSPLLDAPVGVIRLYFQVDAQGEVSSPQVPRGDQRRIARPGTSISPSVVAAEDQLSALAAMWTNTRDSSSTNDRFDSMAAKQAPGASIPPPAPARAGDEVTLYSETDAALKNEFDQRQQRLQMASTPETAPENVIANRARDSELARRHAGASNTPSSGTSVASASQLQGADRKPSVPPADTAAPSRQASPKPRADSTEELRLATPAPEGSPADPALRETAADLSASIGYKEELKDKGPPQAVLVPGPIEPEPGPVAMSDLAPAWIGPDDSPQLVFTRRVSVGGETFSQGFWLDWQLTRSWLLSGIGDLLPWADLQPVLDDVHSRPPEALGRTLASIPAELVIREPLNVADIGWTPLRWGIALAWLAVLASLAVTWRVLRALQELAERRGRFAAAVTHELRTPLTTFCLYSQMLAEDMVPPERRGEYLSTMKNESQRLAGIVESVLEYARLGRRDGRHAVQQIDFHALLSPLVEKLRAGAAMHGFSLQSDISPAMGVIVRADPTGVERVLTNLVDNACKYAKGHTPEAIDLTVTISRRQASITVGDHGPGLTVEESRRVFEPYFRGPRTTDLGVPGLGLGLALAKGVARSMGGDLKNDSAGASGGARFSLILDIVG